MLSVMFPVSVAFMVLVAFGGIIVLLPTYDISMYVSLIGLKLVNSASSAKNRLPKVAFEILLVGVVVLLTASCSSPPTDVVVVVVLPVIDADTRVIVVYAKIIVSVKIVATRWMLRSRGIFLLRLFSIPILSTFQERNKG
jgi:uncharacterized membrane protein YeiB